METLFTTEHIQTTYPLEPNKLTVKLSPHDFEPLNLCVLC